MVDILSCFILPMAIQINYFKHQFEWIDNFLNDEAYGGSKSFWLNELELKVCII